MASVIFNSFKQRFLNGEVPGNDTWNFIPVNNRFKDEFGDSPSSNYKLAQYRSLDDFKMNKQEAYYDMRFSGIRNDITWYRPAETSGTKKPMFITSGAMGEKGVYSKESNWERFCKTTYYSDISANKAISDYLEQGGFYYIRTKEELRWFADHVNEANNRVIGVIGDDINGVIRGQIGKDEKYPFQGIFDGNGHTVAGTIICDNDDNGLVGVLGQDGIVRNFKLREAENDATTLVCNKLINLNHIKSDGRDVNAGILVGRNYGRVENIDGSQLNNFTFSGFVPQVYSVSNKSDEYTDFSTIRKKYDDGENFYFLNSWCINSPGNICPYVGYFAEGLYAQYGGGYNTNGQFACVEAAPRQRATYYTGLTPESLDLTENVADIAYFIKYFGNRGKGYIDSMLADDAFKRIYENDKSRLTVFDDPYGRNMILIIGQDAVNEDTGAKTRYFLEIHGTAFDKKAGMGERRYKFRAGRMNLSVLPWLMIDGAASFDANDITLEGVTFDRNPDGSIKYDEQTHQPIIIIQDKDEDGDPVTLAFDDLQHEDPDVDPAVMEDIQKELAKNREFGYFLDPDTEQPVDLFKKLGLGVDTEAGEDATLESHIINMAIGFSWNNESYDQRVVFRYDNTWIRSLGWQSKISDVGIGLETDYIVGEDDIKIFTQEGTPAKIVSKNFTNLAWEPKYRDSSTHCWDRMIINLATNPLGSMQLTAKNAAGEEKTFKYYWNEEWLKVWYAGNPSQNYPGWQAVSPVYKYYSEEKDRYILISARDNDLVRQKPGLSENDIEKKYGPWWTENCCPLAAILSIPNHALGGAFKTDDDTTGYVISEKMLIRCFLQNMTAMTEGLIDTDPSFWQDDKDWSGWLINDEDDKSTLKSFYAARTYELPATPEHPESQLVTYWPKVRHTNKWCDVTINDGHVNDIEGSIDFYLIDTKNLHYAPVTHAVPRQGHEDLPCPAGVVAGSVYDTVRDAGSTFGKILSNWANNRGSWTNVFGSELEAATYSMHHVAEMYIKDPRYYGLDFNGDFTTQVVRTSNFAYGYGTPYLNSWGFSPTLGMSTNVIHYNWNIEKMMFKNNETMNGFFTDYDEGDIKDKNIKYLDLPHAVYNKPLRMAHMARAAYNISPVVGANYGHISNVIVKTTRRNRGNFVGFLGGVAGKQERGLVEHVSTDIIDEPTWYMEYAQEPVVDFYNQELANEQISEYKSKIANDNFHVRYKMTPIIPGAKSSALQEIGANPAEDSKKYRYYPEDSEDLVDESRLLTTYEDWENATQAEIDRFTEYLTTLNKRGIRVYRITQDEGSSIKETNYSLQHPDLYPYFTENPNYVNDYAFYQEAKPIIDFCSEWYADCENATTMPLDDVVTFRLRPIFNAGGVFGRLIPTNQNENKIELKTNQKYNIVTFRDINTSYQLNDIHDPSCNEHVNDAYIINKDVHNAFGSFAGLLDVQTSQLGNRSLNTSQKLLSMQSVNSVGKLKEYRPNKTDESDLNMFGYISTQFNEIPSVLATEGPGRDKGGDWTGPDTYTTWAIDVPMPMYRDLALSDYDPHYAPIGNSFAAFYGWDNDTIPDYGQTLLTAKNNQKISKEDIQIYIKTEVLGDIFDFNGVSMNSQVIGDFSNNIDIYKTKKNFQSVDSIFGSYLSFIPNFARTTQMQKDNLNKLKTAQYSSNLAQTFANQELLNQSSPSRIYYRDTVDWTRRDAGAAGQAVPIQESYSTTLDIDKLADKVVFEGKTNPEDLYFSYTYSAASAFLTDFTFRHQVQFTSAVKQDDNRRISDTRKAVYGYAFRDDLTNSADGFKYNNNYLHIGNSVSPRHIRETLLHNTSFTTSAVSAAMFRNNEIVPADDAHQFGGILVTDSQDRNVMFIDNTNGAQLDNVSYNIETPAINYGNTNGGLLMEVN